MRYVAAAATHPTMPAAESAAAEPPLADSYLDLLHRGGGGIAPPTTTEGRVVQERELPLIDLSCLTTRGGGGGAREARACADAMARAASEWGFFQVTGHGVSRALLERLRAEQARLFRLPFETKAKAGLLNGSYRWGAPTATSLRHLSWSEAFHVPLASISGAACDFGDLTSLSKGTSSFSFGVSAGLKVHMGVWEMKPYMIQHRLEVAIWTWSKEIEAIGSSYGSTRVAHDNKKFPLKLSAGVEAMHTSKVLSGFSNK